MENIVRIKGENCNLCTFRTDEIAVFKYTKWFADQEFNHHLFINNFVFNFDNIYEWMNALVRDENKILFNIVVNNNIIGNCELTKDNSNCELALCIGEPDEWEKGYGTEVMNLLIKFCFEEMNFHRLYVRVADDNAGSLKLMKKCGFSVCGKETDALWYKGKWHSIVVLEQIADNYLKN